MTVYTLFLYNIKMGSDKGMRKVFFILGLSIIIFIMLSSVTVVPQVSSRPFIDKVKDLSKFKSKISGLALIKNKIDKLKNIKIMNFKDKMASTRSRFNKLLLNKENKLKYANMIKEFINKHNTGTLGVITANLLFVLGLILWPFALLIGIPSSVFFGALFAITVLPAALLELIGAGVILGEITLWFLALSFASLFISVGLPFWLFLYGLSVGP